MGHAEASDWIPLSDNDSPTPETPPEENTRNWLDALETCRQRTREGSGEATRPRERYEQSPQAAPVNLPEANDPVILKEDLRAAMMQIEMLQEEVNRLEKSALEAIGEAGRMRRVMERMLSEDGERPSGEDADAFFPLEARREIRRLRKELQRGVDERGLLTQALSVSESEIARMTKAIQTLASRIHLFDMQ